MSPRTAAPLAWSLCGVYFLLLGFGLVVGLGATPTFSPVGLDVPVWSMALLGLAFLAFSVMGALVAARHPGNAVGWLLLAIGLSGGLTLALIAYVATALPARRWAEWISTWISTGPFTQIVFVLLLFPDGRLPSTRWRVVAWANALATLAFMAGSLAPYTTQDYAFSNPVGIESLRGSIVQDGTLGWVLLPLTMVAAAACFVVRFRRSTGDRRLQLKWFSFAASLVAAGYLVLQAAWVSSWLLPADDTVLVGTGMLVCVLCLMTVPVASGVAILRYHLYDIDLVINRTLVYGALTAVLALVYLAGVVGIGGLVREVTGQQNNNLVVAASTLVVAAVFRPARTRIQGFIDRRFYRHKYNAEQTLAHFSARLRDQIELDSLSAELLDAVNKTMHPTQASLWLKTP
ncbi:MAG: hypothetical protein H0W55_02010 [Actinobacteria bacterium]|nr:hypothetical protein [Actinomycetota bacterium]MDQ3532229.1 hypothetical protein [Actinomycetota bacterium]